MKTNFIERHRAKINRSKTCQKEHPRGNISLRVLTDPHKIQGVIKPRQNNNECGFLLPIETERNSATITHHYAKSKLSKAMDSLQNKGLLDRLTAPILSNGAIQERGNETNKHASKLSTEPILGDCGGHFNKCAGFLYRQSVNPHSSLFTNDSVFRAYQSLIQGGNHAK